MKHILFILLVCATPCFAKIGDGLFEIERRYGKGTVVYDAMADQIKRQKAMSGKNAQSASDQKDIEFPHKYNTKIKFIFLQNKAVKILFEKTSDVPFTNEEIKAILLENGFKEENGELKSEWNKASYTVDKNKLTISDNQKGASVAFH